MISVCSVILDGMQEYTQVFVHSLLRNCSEISEVIFVKVDGPEGLLSETIHHGVPCRIIGYPLAASFENQYVKEWILQICGHALGLHHAIDQATAPYVWLTDPDVFFFNPVDRIYLDLMQKFDLNIIGISHFNALDQSYLDFPCVTNCLIKKESLPNPDWLSGSLYFRTIMKVEQFTNKEKIVPLDGKYLVPGPIEELAAGFPNPRGFFDVGCNLWLWNQNKRWLSFNLNHTKEFSYEDYGFEEIVYPMNYTTASYRTNFGLKDDLGQVELLYHRTRGAREGGQQFKELYEKIYRTVTSPTE